MTLYEINEELISALENAVDMETGEIVDEVAYENFNNLQMEFAEKTEGILLWIKNLTAEYEALKVEKAAFDSRMKTTGNKVERLKKYVSDVLDGQKFSTTKVSATFRKSESVEYAGDINELPDDCVRVKTEIDKVALKKLLISGCVIPGAKIVTNQNIQIK